MNKVMKRYNDFKDLTFKIKSELKQKKIKRKLFYLPDKGDNGIMKANNDIHVIRYRKEALRNFLQKVADDQVLTKLNSVSEFFGVKLVEELVI